jgi:drug/metabolite transporter (DMT)-like permease
MRSSGTLLCLGSAAAFGAMAIFGKLAYDEGTTVGTLLAVRFTLGALMFWAIVLPSAARKDLRGLTRRDLLIALGLGAAGYALQAGCYFAALTRIDASLLALLLYSFPAIVTVAAIALGRERANARRFAALGLALAGLVLVLASAETGGLDPVGVALAIGAACTYSAYILTSEGVAGRIRASVLSALVCSGAAVSLIVGTTLLGELRPGEVTAEGWGWLACLVVVSTFGAVSMFFAGLKRVGPTTASILSTLEPVVTVLLAFLVFAETLGVVQVLGGTLVLGAVLVLTSQATKPRQEEAAAWAAH